MTEKPEIQLDHDREDRIDEAFGEYLACLDAGQPIDKAEFLAKYPDIADSLAKCLEDESNVRKMAGPTFAETDQGTLGTVIGPVQDAAVQETGAYAQSVDTQTDQKPTDWGIPEKFGRYRVKKLLGQGAMGAVYLAEDTKLHRPTALKIPKFDQQQDAGLLERFYREARAVATLFHPNICPVLDVGEIEGQIFLSMAFIKGRPLSDFARSDKQQSQRSVAKLVMKLAKALKEAHDIGVVHRDLKPANIMVSKKGGEPVVMDFGLARQLDSNEARVTQSGYIVGTPAYMSPEQVEGASDGVGPLSDQYSLGVVLYELLTGQMPFSGSVLSIIGQIAHKEPKPLAELRSDLDPRLAAVCNRMMAKDPAERFEDMAAVASALNSFLTESKTNAAPDNQSQWEINQAAAALESVVASEQRKPRQAAARKKGNPSDGKSPIKRWILIGGTLGLLALLAGVVIFFQNDDGTVRIEITDPKIRVTISDQTFTIDDNGSEIKVTPGKLKLHVEREGLKLDTDEITINKNGKLALKATWMNGELALVKDGKKIAGIGPVVPRTKPATSASVDDSPSAAELLATGEWEWRIVERLPEPINSDRDEFGADMTTDELTIVLGSKRSGSYGDHTDIWIASRMSESEAWSIPKNLGAGINHSKPDFDPQISPNGLSLSYYSERPGSSDARLSHRDSVNSPWSISKSATEYGYPSKFHGSFDLSRDMCTMIGKTYGKKTDICISHRMSPNQPWLPPAILPPPINTNRIEQSPSLSNDSRFLIFARSPNHDPEWSDYEIWMSLRDSRDATWNEPIKLFPGLCPRLLDDEKSMLLTMRLKEDDDLDIYLASLVRKDSPVLPIKGLPGVQQIRPMSEFPANVEDGPKEIWGQDFGGMIYDLELSPDKRTVALLKGYGPSEIVLFDLEKQSIIRRWRTPEKVRSIAFSPDGKTIARSGGHVPVTLYNVESGDEVQQFSIPSFKERTTSGFDFTEVTFSSDGKQLVAGGHDYIYFWDLESNELRTKVSMGTRTCGLGITLSTDGKHIGIGLRNGTLGLLDPHSKTTSISKIGQVEGWPYDIQLSNDGRFLLSTCRLGLSVWDIERRERLHTLEMNHSLANSYAAAFFSQDSLILAGSIDYEAKDGDGFVQAWSTATKQPVFRINGLHPQVMDIVPIDDRKILVADGGNLRLWQLPETIDLKNHSSTRPDIPPKPVVAERLPK